MPFLRELRALDRYYQRFKIDDHLKRYEKALRNLSLAGRWLILKSCATLIVHTGAERFDEALAYVEKHRLYEAALEIWRDTDKYQVRAGSSPFEVSFVLNMR